MLAWKAQTGVIERIDRSTCRRTGRSGVFGSLSDSVAEMFRGTVLIRSCVAGISSWHIYSDQLWSVFSANWIRDSYGTFKVGIPPVLILMGGSADPGYARTNNNVGKEQEEAYGKFGSNTHDHCKSSPCCAWLIIDIFSVSTSPSDLKLECFGYYRSCSSCAAL